MTLARDLFLSVTLLGVTMLVHEMSVVYAAGSRLADSTLSLGFLLLFAFLLGRVALFFRAPMITGFLVAGVMAGPFGLDVVTNDGAEPLRLVDDLALALIAFSAGGELQIKRFRPRLRALVWTAGAQSAFAFGLVFAIFLPLLYITEIVPRSAAMAFSGALLLGIIAAASSPDAAIAVITETRSRGPVSDTILGVTVFKDVMVIIMFGLAMSLASALAGDAGTTGWVFMRHVAYDVSVSLSLGAVAGGLMVAYLKGDYGNNPLFVVGAALIVSQVCQALEIRPLLAAITAGFVVENLSREGERLIEGLETSSLPIYMVFFSLAGQGLDLDALAMMWPYAMIYAAARVIGTRAGVFKGMGMSGEDRGIAGHAWAGFIAQGGVSLGFAMMVGRQFPDWGAGLSTIAIAAIVINLMVGPVMMKRSLTSSGEAKAELDEDV